MFEQIMLVRTNLRDDYDGLLHYTLYEVCDDETDGLTRWDLYEGDDKGNGVRVCRGDNERRMCSLALALGELVEYRQGQKPRTTFA